MIKRQIQQFTEDKDKGMRGPNIPDDWKRYIMVQALKEHYKPRMLLASEILKQMEESRDTRGRLPEAESIAKLVSRARNHKTSVDIPWSIGIYDENAILPEATADFLEVWKCCLAIGHTFTIREAKWVARVRTAIQKSENVYQHRGAILFGYANEYAVRERISEILDIPMDTRDIDGNLCFQERDWDWTVFRAIGLIPRLTTKYYNKELSEYNPFNIYINVASYVAEQNMPRVDLNIINGLAVELSEMQAYMFAALLSYLSKGPLWKEIPNWKYPPILYYLKDLVTKELVDDLEDWQHGRQTYENLEVSNWRDRPNGLAPEDVLSSDLLRLVGYQVETHIETVDKPHPFLKNYPERKPHYKAVFTLNLDD